MMAGKTEGEAESRDVLKGGDGFGWEGSPHGSIGDGLE